MTEKLISIIDNGPKVRGECNDCGASLRYEYVTDSGIYGSECVHRHIHRPDWMTLKAKYDAKRWLGIQNTLNALTRDLADKRTIEYVEYRDGSISIRGIWQYYNALAVTMFIYNLIDSGWEKTSVEAWIAGSNKYTITRPTEKEQA